MGYYIEVPEKKGKAQQIVKMHGGRILSKAPVWEDAKSDEAIVCVIDNGAWEGAGFCHSKLELERFTTDYGYPDHYQRSRTWLIMNREKACKLTHFGKYS